MVPCRAVGSSAVPPACVTVVAGAVPDLGPMSCCGGEVGNGGGRPPQGVYAGRRDGGGNEEAHNGHTGKAWRVWALCRSCAVSLMLRRCCYRASKGGLTNSDEPRYR